MIDTHAHLNFPELFSQIEEIVKKSKKIGLRAIIIASSSITDSKLAVDLAKKYPEFLYASVGIHPQKTDPDNKDFVKDQLARLEKMVKENHDQIVGIGETGLDFGKVPPNEEKRSKEEQEKLFSSQIDLASQYNLPLIIHAREANDEVIEILKSKPESNGVFHCYSGGKKRIQKILNLPRDWCFGFDGNLTYDTGLQNVFKLIPQKKILLETDAPFLAPEPHRGEICTPTYLPIIAEKMAQILETNVEDMSKLTDENVARIFGI